MSHITLSETARRDLQRLYHFLAEFDVTIADNGIEAIIQGITYLEKHPLSGSPLEDRPNVRKSTVSFGASGYLIFHKRYANQDINLVTRIIHQKEWYEAETIGRTEEVTKETNP